MITTLLTTADYATAISLGYDCACDPREACSDGPFGEGLIVTTERIRDIPYVKLIGPDGEVELGGAPEILAVIEALCAALRPQRSELVAACFDIAAAGAGQ